MDGEFAIPELQTGVYEHYKGKQYEVIGIALHTETVEPMVVYRPLYKTDVSFWTRPYDIFVSPVRVDGVDVPRFQRLSE